MEGFTVLRWKKHRKGFLEGFADIQMGEYILRGVTVHLKGDRMWANPPARPYETDEGETAYSRTFDFTDKETYFAWSDAVITALKRYQAGDDAGEVPWEEAEAGASF